MRGKRVAGEREEIKLGGLLPLSFSLRSTILNTAPLGKKRNPAKAKTSRSWKLFSLPSSFVQPAFHLSLALTTLPTHL